MKKTNLFIGGQYRDFYFGLGFLGRLLDETNTDMSDLDRLRTANPFKWLPLMMFHSCAYGYIREGKEHDFVLQDVINWIDEVDVEILKQFNTAFIASLTKDVPMQPDTKKKVTTK